MTQSHSHQTSWHRSKHYLGLGLGLLFLSLEAPAFAHLTHPPAEEAELIEALAEPPKLEPVSEQPVSEQLDAEQLETEQSIVEQSDAIADSESLDEAPDQSPIVTELDALADSMVEQLQGEASNDSPDGIATETVELEQEGPRTGQEAELAEVGGEDTIANPEPAQVSPEVSTDSEVEVTIESEVRAEEAKATAESEALVEPEATADVEEAVDSGEGLDPNNAEESLAEEQPAEEQLAEDLDPIPSLADRCAASEATLFPPEPDPEEGLPEGEAALDAENEAGVDAENTGAAETEANETTAGETNLETDSETITEANIQSESDSNETSEPSTTAEANDDTVVATTDSAEATDSADGISDNDPIVEPDTDLEELDEEAIKAKAEAEKAAAEEKERICALFQADQRYESGDLADAETLYRAAKTPFELELEAAEQPKQDSITDPEELSAAGRVFLREAEAGQEQNLETRILVPLDLLVKQHPEFIPGQIQLSQALVQAGRSEEGLAVLNQATSKYPNEPSLIRANIALAADQKEWMDAVMLARRFAQLNPEHPEAEEFTTLAEENMELYKRDVRDRLRTNTIANVLTGAISVALTGNVWNSLSAVQTTAMMLRGEEGVGKGISKSIQRQLEMVEDEEIVEYIDEMGQRLAKVAGRDEFEYEFSVVMDDNLNAFALPGGKIFVNAGAIAKTESEAELAGLLSHEIAHAVLSHGFRLVSDGNLLADLTRFVPYGGYASNLVVLNYSRNMEREADELGARILASAGYAADGLHGLMQTLGEGNSRRPLFAWMSTHPETEERVSNLEEQITREGLERYQFEGVERHHQMRVKIKQLINEWKIRKAKEAEERPWWR